MELVGRAARMAPLQSTHQLLGHAKLASHPVQPAKGRQRFACHARTQPKHFTLIIAASILLHVLWVLLLIHPLFSVKHARLPV